MSISAKLMALTAGLERIPTSTRRITAVAAAAVAVLLLIGFLPSRFWPFIINGIADGSIYSLAAIGLVLTYKTSGIFNFAIGTQAATSAYLFYTLHVDDHLAWPVAALISLIVIGLGGAIILERVAFLLAGAPVIMRVVASIGLLVLLQSLLTGAYGQATLPLKTYLPNSTFSVGSITITLSQVIVTSLALGATTGLYLFFKQHRVGVAMQALVDDPDLLALDAISPIAIRRYAWAIGSCFVSVSGMLVAPLLGVDVNEMLLLYITAFGAAALGSFSSLPVTFIAALGVGIATNVASYAFSGVSNSVISELYTQVPFLVLALALLFIPKRKLIERGERKVRQLPRIRPVGRPLAIGSAGVAVVLGLIFPTLVGQVDLNQYSTGLGFAIVFASLGLLIWTSGQISLCQMAFAAVGATTFAHLQHAGVPWLFALLIGGLVAVPVGAVAAIPSFRLSGIYLAVATFGLGLLFQNLVYTTFLMFGANDFQKVSRPALGSIHLSSDEGYFYVSLVVAALCGAAVLLIGRTRLGRLLRALSDSPIALQAHAANTRITRLYVFCIAAFMAGIGGAMIAGVTRNAAGQASGAFGYFNSVAIVAVLAFCARRPIVSPMVAAFLFEVIRIYKPFNDVNAIKYQGVVFGLLAIGVAIFPALRVRRSDDVRLADRWTESPVVDRNSDPLLKRAYA